MSQYKILFALPLLFPWLLPAALLLSLRMPRGIETKQNSSCPSLHICPLLGFSSALSHTSVTASEG